MKYNFIEIKFYKDGVNLSPAVSNWQLNHKQYFNFKLKVHMYKSLITCTCQYFLTHWGRVTHICVSKLTIIGSDNGLSPGRRQAIIWTNDGILLIRTFRTHFSEIVSEIHTFSFKKMHFKMSSGKWRPSCLGLNELRGLGHDYSISSMLAMEILQSWAERSIDRFNLTNTCTVKPLV